MVLNGEIIWHLQDSCLSKEFVTSVTLIVTTVLMIVVKKEMRHMAEQKQKALELVLLTLTQRNDRAATTLFLTD